MKRRLKPLFWMLLPAAAVLLFFLVRSPRPPSAEPGPEAPRATARTAPPTAPPDNRAPEEKAASRTAGEGKALKPSAKPAAGPLAAIIIDDIGYSLEAIETAHKIGRPLTVSILPDASLTEESVRLAAACGLEIMLHLPLESTEEKNGIKVFAGTISGSMKPAAIRAAVKRALALIPGAAGVNNHAGSSATEEKELMRPILQVLKARGLYFIDSRTTRETVAQTEAESLGVPNAARNVFLDAEPGDEPLAARLRELFGLAKKNGRAVGICHPKRESLAALARHIALADAYGVTLVFASAIVR